MNILKQQFASIFFSLIIIQNSNLQSNSAVPAHQDRLDFVSVDYVLKKFPEITYQQCHPATPFEYPEFPFSMFPEEQPHKGMFAPTYVLNIPFGKVYSWDGFVTVADRYMIKDILPRDATFTWSVNWSLHTYPKSQARKVPGRVVVLTKPGVRCYGHWLIDILGRLAIVEYMGISYDWLYVVCDRPFMQDSLKSWGINLEKVIQPFGEFSYIQADELIVPSFPNGRQPISGQTFDERNTLCAYCTEFVMHYLREKFLAKAQAACKDQIFSKRIFISRDDLTVGRRVLNEVDVFACFEPYGFKKYMLSKMTFLEQVALFNQAEIIVSANGSGLTNVMFAKPGAQVVELFQARSDSSFHNLCSMVGLNYIPVKTCEFTGKISHEDTSMPLEIMHQVIDQLNIKK